MQRTGRALQQAYAKPILEPHDTFAYRRPRQTDTFRRRGKAFCLGNVHKSMNVPHSFNCHCFESRLGVFSGTRIALRLGHAIPQCWETLSYFRLPRPGLAFWLGASRIKRAFRTQQAQRRVLSREFAPEQKNRSDRA
jgi:hypothetical protein